MPKVNERDAGPASAGSGVREYGSGIWEDLHTTVLFITHDIEEALFLADRVVIMSAGPGRIIDNLPVTLARPRHADVVYGTEFIRLKRHCAQLIRTESLRAFEQQTIVHRP